MTQNIDTTDTTETATISEPETVAKATETPAETTPETPAEKPKKEKKVKEPKAPKPPKEPKVKKEKPVREVPAHLAKVDKVAAQLPALSTVATDIVERTNSMATADICSIIAHLQIAVRRRGVTSVATASKLNVGDRVSIVSSSNPRFIGQMGTVDKVQRIRCYVRLDDKEYSQKDGRPMGDYFFLSDVSPVESLAVETPAEESVTEELEATGT